MELLDSARRGASREGIRCSLLDAEGVESRNGKADGDGPIRTANLASPGGRDGVYEVPAVAWFAA